MISESMAKEASAKLHGIADNVETVIVGKREQVELVVMSLIAQGHVLLEDLPGTGKTSLVSALAKSVDCAFNRIQFTPDIMPSDVTGFSIYNQKTHDFEFRPGGVMSNLVLVDEINRASAKTQAALLEAMEERQVTVDGETHKLTEPFMVLATQNPIEQYGTYPLPEAQLDRFLIKLSMGYPLLDEEVKVVLESKAAKARIHAIVTMDEILRIRKLAEEVHVSVPVARYAVQVVTSTRSMKECSCGASPRASIALVALARANALMRGRTYVMPDDIKYLAPYVLAHRITLTHEAKVSGRNPWDIIGAILDSVAVPTVSAAEMPEAATSQGVTLGRDVDAQPAAQPAAAEQPAVQQPVSSADESRSEVCCGFFRSER
ncbi:MAG: MoxR family ATPase [Coriobacteriia bacterium]|nr:MoxR family ATPase [Coriobacteriia bacterium]